MVLDKIQSLLVPGGYCLISVANSGVASTIKTIEGYFPKESTHITRFLTRYNRNDFKNTFKNLEWAKVSTEEDISLIFPQSDSQHK